MRERSKKRILLICLAWFAVALIAAAIFFLSNQQADESAALSRLFEIRISRFLTVKVSDFVVRKFAHATEYFALACTLFAALYITVEKKRPLMAFILCVAYSVSDEIHQYFVPGRACKLFDVGVDSLGAVLGILLCMAILFIRYRKKSE